MRQFKKGDGEAAFDRLQLLLELDEAEWADFRREEEDMEAWDSDEEDEEEEETESDEVSEEDTKDGEEDDDVLENDSASVHYK